MCVCIKYILRGVTAKEDITAYFESQLRISFWVSFREQLLLNMGRFQYFHFYCYHDKPYFKIHPALNDKEEVNFLLVI